MADAVTVENVRNSLDQIDLWLDAIGKALTNNYPGAEKSVAEVKLKIEEIRAVMKGVPDELALRMAPAVSELWTVRQGFPFPPIVLTKGCVLPPTKSDSEE